MRTRLFTTVACTMVLAGTGAGTAFASDTSSQPTTAPSTAASPSQVPIPAASSAPSAAPTTMPSARPSAGAVPTTPPAPSRGGNQVGAVPSGAPNTGVPSDTSHGPGQAEAAGAGLALLLGGAGGVMLRRRNKARG
ncbi:hypothetical protein ABH926_007330 [Catenulispora sp. GP43]|uniref:sortase-dependent protein n=1 Tax=Catenulispora sp. GP43 TaxID=3156263 RepID=UPI0035139D58